MWSTKITFKSLNETLAFLVESESEVLIKDFFFGLYNIFGDINNSTIESLQKNDVQTKSKVEEFVVKFKSKFPPSIWRIKGIYRK